MTLIYESELDILQMYLHTKHDVSRSRLSKVDHEQDKYRNTQTVATERITTAAFACGNKDAF